VKLLLKQATSYNFVDELILNKTFSVTNFYLLNIQLSFNVIHQQYKDIICLICHLILLLKN